MGNCLQGCPSRSPHIRLKRVEILVEYDLTVWQHEKHTRRIARERDPKQTLDEPACAAALSRRWKHANYPHRSRKQKPGWRAVGFLLDLATERYPLMLTEAQIEDVRRRKAQD